MIPVDEHAEAVVVERQWDPRISPLLQEIVGVGLLQRGAQEQDRSGSRGQGTHRSRHRVAGLVPPLLERRIVGPFQEIPTGIIP
jgi:hypothetical protein